mmetsp:Transcript_9658/g.35826  ORF Transcript_9658/g.35826 Transcript_9658/m.35826 type:complete len:688 (+) Transcript_9658:1234-3297(+)
MKLERGFFHEIWLFCIFLKKKLSVTSFYKQPKLCQFLLENMSSSHRPSHRPHSAFASLPSSTAPKHPPHIYSPHLLSKRNGSNTRLRNHAEKNADMLMNGKRARRRPESAHGGNFHTRHTAMNSRPKSAMQVTKGFHPNQRMDSQHRLKQSASNDAFLVWKLENRGSSSRNAHRILDEEHVLEREYLVGSNVIQAKQEPFVRELRDSLSSDRSRDEVSQHSDPLKRTHDLLDESPPQEKLRCVEEEIDSLCSTRRQLSTAMERYSYFDRLLELRVEAMALSNLCHGPDSLKMIEAIVNLGHAYIDASNFQQAAVHLKRGLSELTRYLDRIEDMEDSGPVRTTATSMDEKRESQNNKQLMEGESNPYSSRSTAGEGSPKNHVHTKLLPDVLCALCKAYIHMQAQETALACLKEAKRQFEKLNPSHEFHHDIELLFFLMHESTGAFDDAIASLQRAWQSLDEQYEGNQEYADIASIHQLMGKTYRKMNRMDDCLNSLKTALGIFKALGDSTKELNLFCAIGAAHSSEGQLTEALKNFKSASQICEQLHGKDSLKAIEIAESVAQIQYSLILKNRANESHPLDDEQGEQDKSSQPDTLVYDTIETLETLIHHKLESARPFEPKKMIVLYERLGDCYGLRGECEPSQKLAYQTATIILKENFSVKELSQTNRRLAKKLATVKGGNRNQIIC